MIEVKLDMLEKKVGKIYSDIYRSSLPSPHRGEDKTTVLGVKYFDYNFQSKVFDVSTSR
ncbi:MAG: hypothetical protein HY887_07175 [Deltaproteobacteria bacterium]|nr:hypothetical protein [Deltaproteobacteria bacterium]